MTPEGWKGPPLPGAIARQVGKGKVVYLAAGIDAALWSYAYPYSGGLTRSGRSGPRPRRRRCAC